MWRLRWHWLPGKEAMLDEQLVAACAKLFSEHYGKWGPAGPNPGEPIRMPQAQIRALLSDETAWLACAFDQEKLVGYCVAAKVDVPDVGRIDWVTQLVVHSSYRMARVATTLLYSIWHFSDCYAWGLVTANPFAVRALETATRRPCRLAEIRRQGPSVLRAINGHVPYLPDDLEPDEQGLLRPSSTPGSTSITVNSRGCSGRRRARGGHGHLGISPKVANGSPALFGIRRRLL
jgi:hypothetical protein